MKFLSNKFWSKVEFGAVSRAISSINTVLRANRSKYKNVEKLFFRSDDVFVRLFIASSDELFTEMIK